MKSMSEFTEKLKSKHNNFKSLLNIFRIVINFKLSLEHLGKFKLNAVLSIPC